MTFLRLLEQLLVPFLMLFIFVGSLGGAALGAGLLWRTASTLRLVQGMNRWVSTRRATRPLETPHDVLPRSKWLGAFLVAGGLFAVYYLVVRLQIPRGALSPADPRFATALAVDAARWLLVAGCLVSVVMGAFVLWYPAILDRLEQRLNRWVSTRTMISAEGDRMRTPLDRVVETHPRTAGWLILLSSFAVAVAMGALIAAHWPR